MSYVLKTDKNEIIPIDVTNRIDFNFANAIVVYESLGEDGGYTINNGRLNSSLALNIAFAKYNVDDAFTLISKLKSIRGPISIAGNSKAIGKIFGQFVIDSIPGNVEEGSELIKITLNLKEYRQANVRKNVINAVYQGDAIVDFLKQHNFTSS